MRPIRAKEEEETEETKREKMGEKREREETKLLLFQSMTQQRNINYDASVVKITSADTYSQ